MSKLKNDDLFLLIKSMKKGEKRHFKIFASRHVIGKQNAYVELFDLIEQQKEYNEDELVKKRLFSKQISTWKNRLYESILKSLEAFHAEETSEITLRSYLNKIDILLQKKLLYQCERLVSKAKDIASKHENHFYLAECIKKEIEVNYAQFFADKKTGGLKPSYDLLFSSIEKFKNENQYSELLNKFYLLRGASGFSRSKVEMGKYLKILDSPLLRDEQKATSFRSRHFFYMTHSVFFQIKTDYKNALLFLNKQLKHLEASPYFIKENSPAYVACLHNIVLTLSNLGRYPEALQAVKKFQQLHVKTESLQQQIFMTASNLELEIYANTAQTEDALKVIKVLNAKTDSMGARERVIFYFSAAYMNIMARDFKVSKTFLNKIINDPNSDVRSDIYCFAMILNIIVHYELGNETTLEYIVKSTYRFLYKRNKLYKYETILLNFIKTVLPRIKTKNDLVKAWKHLKQEIEIITKDPYEKKALDYFDLISWLESKITDRPFAEILKRKIEAQ